MARRFEFSVGTSHKFWEIALAGSSFTVTFGRIGTNGQTQTKTFASDAKARAEADKLVREKTAKGYVEAGGSPALATASERASPGPSAPDPAPVERPAAAPIAEPVPAAAAAAPDPRPDLPRVVWTPGARRRLSPRRPCPSPAPLADPWTAVREGWRGIDAAVRRGLEHAEGPHAGWMEAVLRSADLDAPPAPLDAQVEGARAALLGFENNFLRHSSGYSYGHAANSALALPLLDVWLGEAGAAFAVEAAAATFAVEGVMDLRRGPAQEERWLEPRTARSWEPQQPTPVWRRLRQALEAEEEAAHLAARQRAAELYAAGGGLLRRALAYLFPDEPWANELALGIAGGTVPRNQRDWWLLASLSDPSAAEALCAVLRHGALETDLCFDLVAGLGAAAAPALEMLLEQSPDAGSVEALALVESRRVAAWMARRCGEKPVAAAAAGYFARHPGTSLRALSEAAALTPGGPAAVFLRQAALDERDTARATLAELDGPARAALEAVLDAGRELPDADPLDLPPVLAQPPWLGKRRALPATVVEGLAVPAREERLLWKPGERERLARPPYWHDRHAPPAPETDAGHRRELERRRSEGTIWDVWSLFRLTDEAALSYWNGTPPGTWYAGGVEAVLALLGLPALPGFLAFAEREPARAVEILARVDSPRVAALMAHAALRVKKARRTAQAWLLAFPEAAAAGLVPGAVGAPGPAREAAGAALRLLAERGHGETVRAAAAHHGAQALTAVEGVLAFDPLLLFPARLPKPASFWSAAALPRPLLRGRERALPLPAVEALGTMLAISSIDLPYAGLAAVREACDARSLAEFAWALFLAWQVAGAPPREGWAFQALGHLGDDETARRLTPLIRTWPQEGQSARAQTGLDILSRIGTDVALLHLHGIAQKVKSRPLQERAQARIEQIAEERGLSAEELADRLVPDLGLDADGSRVLDFGPRAFRVGFDEQLRPFVKDQDGKRLAELPKPGRADDEERASSAVAAWKGLKKDARGLVATQVGRLEQAMCLRRRWPPEVFRAFLLEHPLMGHIVRRLVWGAYDGAGGALQASFRVAEDGSLADLEDGPYELPGSALVGLPHRLELTEALVQAWSQVLADYQILQPFPQLGRAVHVRPAEHAGLRELPVLQGTKVHVGKVLGLERRGWRRGEVGDGGVTGAMVKPLAGRPDHDAELSLDPGIYAGAVAEFAEQTLGALVVQRRGTWGAEDRLTFGELDPIAYSELVADLQSLTA